MEELILLMKTLYFLRLMRLNGSMKLVVLSFSTMAIKWLSKNCVCEVSVCMTIFYRMS